MWPNLKNYLRQLSKARNTHTFIFPWGGVCLQNCDSNGDLLTFSRLAEFTRSRQSLWLYLPLYLFRDEVEIKLDMFFFKTMFQGTVPIFKCPQCADMASISDLALDQKVDQLFELRCIHSKAAAYFAADYENHWSFTEMRDTDQSFKVECNLDIETQLLREDDLFLAAYQKNGVVSLLFTVSSRQKYPICSNCATKRCKCFRRYQKAVNDVDANREEFWQRRRTDRPEPLDHYLEISSQEDYIRRYGHNRTSFAYPISRDEDLKVKFIRRTNGSLDLPARIMPCLEPQVCDLHQNAFSESPNEIIKIICFLKVQKYHSGPTIFSISYKISSSGGILEFKMVHKIKLKVLNRYNYVLIFYITLLLFFYSIY